MIHLIKCLLSLRSNTSFCGKKRRRRWRSSWKWRRKVLYISLIMWKKKKAKKGKKRPRDIKQSSSCLNLIPWHRWAEQMGFADVLEDMLSLTYGLCVWFYSGGMKRAFPLQKMFKGTWHRVSSHSITKCQEISQHIKILILKKQTMATVNNNCEYIQTKRLWICFWIWLVQFPPSSLLSYDNYQPGRVYMLPLRQVKPANCIFSNYCSCCMTGQSNTFRGKCYPLVL